MALNTINVLINAGSLATLVRAAKAHANAIDQRIRETEDDDNLAAHDAYRADADEILEALRVAENAAAIAILGRPIGFPGPGAGY